MLILYFVFAPAYWSVCITFSTLGGLASMGSNFTYLASKTRRSGDLRGGQRTVPEFETQTIEREDCRACRK